MGTSCKSIWLSLVFLSFLFFNACKKNENTPPPVVYTYRDVSVRYGIKVASSSSGYYVLHTLTPDPTNITKALPPSNDNVVFTKPVIHKVVSISCGGESFSGTGSPDQIQWYSPVGSSSNTPFVAYIMFDNDTVFKKSSTYDTDYKGHIVEYKDECLKKL